MRPFIGIAPSFAERGRCHPSREYHYIDSDYARSVAAAGGVPLYLPTHDSAATLLDRVDGLIIPGGPDFVPERAYPDSVKFDAAPPRQLEFDRSLLRNALDRDLPLLAICYGMQLLALHHGGSLHYDVAIDVPGAGPHQLADPEGRHALRVAPGTRLADVLGASPGPVNSRHHQAVASPGEGLRVCARAEDGLIEAIEGESSRFCIGVQWHPESLPNAHRDRLFGAFAAACRA